MTNQWGLTLNSIMDKRNFRIEGIYDKMTLDSLYYLGVNCFAFDLRPRSLGFTQSDLASKILKDAPVTSKFDLLVDANDSIFMLHSYRDLLPGGTFVFQGIPSRETLNQLGANFSLRDPSINDLEYLKTHPRFVGVEFTLGLLEDINSRGKFSEFFRSILSLHGVNEFSIGLSLDFLASPFPSLIDFIPFDFFSFSVSNSVEKSYRNIDIEKLNKTFIASCEVINGA